ncbi:MAG: PAS domain S-box protein [Ectothiorhodospiraceae bacterium]|nr:PAS domain S-box protein [Ectothiorhodospiraceae bacterium]
MLDPNSLEHRDHLMQLAGKLVNMGAWLATPTPSGLRLYWSDEVCAIHGIPAGSAPSLDEAVVFYAPEYRERIAALFNDCLHNGIAYDEDLQIIDVHGLRRWVRALGSALRDEQGRIVQVYGTFQDISRRKSMQEQLRRSEGLLRMATGLGRLGGWALELDPRRLTWSDGVCDMLGYPRGTEPQQDDVLAPYTAASAQRLDQAVRACITRQQMFDLELQRYDANGVCLDVRIIGQPDVDASGRVQRVEGAIQDITRQRQTEREASRLAERLTTTLESITDAFFTLDRDWRVTFMNGEAERLLGCSRRNLLGRVMWEEYPDAEDSIFGRSYRRALTENVTVAFEAYYGPIERWLSVSAYPSDEGLAIYFRDITERRRAREALQISEERMKLAARATTDAIWDWNPDNDTLWWNEGIQILFGYGPDELEPDSTSWANRLHPEDRDRAVASVLSAIKGGTDEWVEEYRFRRKDGSYAHVVDKGQIVRGPDGRTIRMVGGMADITERKQYESRLAQQAALLDKARDAIIVLGVDQRIHYWNTGAERLYGWSRQEAVGRPLRDLLHERSTGFVTAFSEVLEQGEWYGEIAQRTREGNTVMVEGHWTLVTDAAGEPDAVLVINTDISRRLALESQLRQSQRLESVGQLTGGVAHDFNNLLTVILGNADMLVEELPEGSLQQRLAGLMRDAAQRGAELTNRLLAFARRQALEPRAVNVNSLLTDLDGLLRRTLDESIRMETVCAPELSKAFVDPAQLEAALLNLALNARDAMPGGGRLTIETDEVELAQDYTSQHADVSPGRYVLVAVSDTGIGMQPDLLARAFDPFFTTKDKGRGSGLGLSMVYGFVKQSRGHVKIYSEPGVGTTVKLYLPRAGHDAPLHQQEAGPSDVPTGSELVLLVEDDDLVRVHAETLLLGLGYRVLTADGGEQALEVIRYREDIDLLFTDVVMPGAMGGPELVAEARRLRPGLRVLYTSGYTENAIVHHGRLDAGVQLLQKPYRRLDLARKVREALASPPEEG